MVKTNLAAFAWAAAAVSYGVVPASAAEATQAFPPATERHGAAESPADRLNQKQLDAERGVQAPSAGPPSAEPSSAEPSSAGSPSAGPPSAGPPSAPSFMGAPLLQQTVRAAALPDDERDAH